MQDLAGTISRQTIAMKVKAGDSVEVLRITEEPYRSWFPAEILSVDGCKSTVRYKQFLTAVGKPVIEKVHEEYIRPPPPHVHMEKKWILGDIVEVLDLHSWRVGKIVKVLRNDYFVARIFGAIQLKEFHVSNLRVQQAWCDDQWVVTDKVSGKKQFDNSYPHSSSKYTTGMGKKRRANLEAGGLCQRTKRTLSKKVDTGPLSKSMVRQNCIHASIKIRMAKLVEMDADNGHTKNHMHSPSVSLPITEENNECSIASCSANNLPEYITRNTRKHSREKSSSFFDDASSSCPSKMGEEYPSVPGEMLANDIHELEIHAYRSTVQALYASGPLSWEQELLLTNLRLSLHITNEEHLLQLRNLLSP